jgi:hypothetical protein
LIAEEIKYSEVQFEYNRYTEVKLPDEEKCVFYHEREQGPQLWYQLFIEELP